MAEKNHVYNIDLNIRETAATKQAMKELQKAFAENNNSVDELNKTYIEMAKHTEDYIGLERQYDKMIGKILTDKDKEIDQLEAEKVIIAANRDLTKSQKEEQLKNVKAKIQQIKQEKELIKTKERETKLYLKTKNIVKQTTDSMAKTVKLQNEQLRKQEQLNRALKKEESIREKIVRSVGSIKNMFNFGGIGGAINAGLGVIGSVVGAVTSFGGAVINSGQQEVDKGKALKSLKSGIDPSIVDQVYIQSGADWGSIVAALNNLSDVTKDNGMLVQGAVLELANPGIGKVLLSTSKPGANDVTKLANGIDQIKKQTGSQDLSSALEASTRSRRVTTGAVSQVDYIHAYAALAQRGLDEETINKVIEKAISGGGNFIENLNKLDLASFVDDPQFKTRLSRVALDLKQVDANKATEKTEAEKIAEELREFELEKNKILKSFLPIVNDLMIALKPIIPKIVSFIKDGAAFLSKAVNFALDSFSKGKSPVGAALDVIKPDLKQAGMDIARFFYRPRFAQGGIATAPSLAGEAGPELILPLDYSRAGRSSQIINNFNTNQNFNMAASEQTPLAFASAVGRNKFITRTAR